LFSVNPILPGKEAFCIKNQLVILKKTDADRSQVAFELHNLGSLALARVMRGD